MAREKTKTKKMNKARVRLLLCPGPRLCRVGTYSVCVVADSLQRSHYRERDAHKFGENDVGGRGREQEIKTKEVESEREREKKESECERERHRQSVSENYIESQHFWCDACILAK